MNSAAHIFAAPMLNRLVRGEAPTNGDKRLPFIAHQVSRGIDLFLEHPFDFIRSLRIGSRPFHSASAKRVSEGSRARLSGMRLGFWQRSLRAKMSA